MEGLARRGVCADVSFTLHRGEILGFAGLVGAGRTEIMQLIYGYRKKDAGRVFVKGREVKIRGTRDAVKNGIALIPEERKKQGLILGLSVLDNSALTIFDLHSRGGFILWREIGKLVRQMVSNLGIQHAIAQPDGAKPLRRKPAKGRTLQVVRAAMRRVYLRRADARHRRRRQG